MRGGGGQVKPSKSKRNRQTTTQGIMDAAPVADIEDVGINNKKGVTKGTKRGHYAVKTICFGSQR